MFKIKAICHYVLISCLFDSNIEDDTIALLGTLKFNLIQVRTSHKSIAIIKVCYVLLSSKEISFNH